MRGLLILASACAITVSLAPGEPNQVSSHPAEEEQELMSAETFAGLKLRSLGPALMAGRVADFAVDPDNPAHYYVAVASGGVWKTVNSGTTWTPVFDKQGSFSIGCVTMDPHNPLVVWVGTGENNSQRSVAFGDGVYRTRDGGKSWQNMGLNDSEHIGMILVDPRDSDTVYVAAQGPLWRPGPQRGLYKTTNGGETWTCVLRISDDTGVNEVHMDPRDPDVFYASAYQRRRRVWTLIDGGPESAIYKSTDAGIHWRKLTTGLPEMDMGRIGLAVSPPNPDVIYAIIEAADGRGGFFRSTDRGETWEKRSDYMTTSPQYYNEIICDPVKVDRVYALDTFMQRTEDGGKTFQRVPRHNRHVDDHALWIDPDNNNHLLVGCDGGVYESHELGENWAFKANLSVTQFYRVSADEAAPFYNVYGGTQDNNTLGAPARTRDRIGIANEHWFETVGGDGYKTQIDPVDPNIVYSQWQYGGLIRFDKRTGERVDIKPHEAPGEPPDRWNWDSPLILSPHNHHRLYFAANRLFRSDDRGNSWTAISGDLTRQLDRNQLEVMGRIQSADAVAKHWNTSFFGNAVSLSESPLVEGLIYVGTDDGLIQVTEDGGKNWRRLERFTGVPEMTYISCLLASRHNADTVYAAFDNHKNGDFRPYLLVSRDRGRNWSPIAGDLPPRDIVYTIDEDHEQAALLFTGTEFGAYFTVDGGQRWIKLTGDMPTISVRDLVIQRRENDLVLGTFGRGIYILDDYTPLRTVTESLLAQDVVLFPVKTALRYIERSRLGGRNGKGSQGASFFAAPNPPFGAVFTYYLKEKLTTRKERRQEAEKQARAEGRAVTVPTIEELRAEDEEKVPSIVLIVRDAAGNVVRRVTGPREKGFQRVAWDLRFPAITPTEIKPPEPDPWDDDPVGRLAPPGKYAVTLCREVDGIITALAVPEQFEVVPLDAITQTAQERAQSVAFQQKVARLRGAVEGALRTAGEVRTRLTHLRKALIDTPAADPALLARIDALDKQLNKLLVRLRGDDTRNKRMEPTPPSISARINDVAWNQWYTTTGPTQTQQDAYRYAGTEFAEVLSELRRLVETDLKRLEAELEQAGAPWTPGRIPQWKME